VSKPWVVPAFTVIKHAPIPEDSICHAEEVLSNYIDNLPEPDNHDLPNVLGDRADGEYKNRHWDMVRELKDDSYMASLDGCLAVPILQHVLQGLGYELTDLGYETDEEAIDDLENVWDAVKLGMHEAPLGAALRMADRHPMKFRTKRLSARYKRFLNVAYRLQVMRGDDYIALPVERVGQMLGVSPMRITDYRTYAQADGFLFETAKACFSQGGGGIGTKFRLACRVEGDELVGAFSTPPALEIKTPAVQSEATGPISVI
jgi:hypothetical protein